MNLIVFRLKYVSNIYTHLKYISSKGEEELAQAAFEYNINYCWEHIIENKIFFQHRNDKSV